MSQWPFTALKSGRTVQEPILSEVSANEASPLLPFDVFKDLVDKAISLHADKDTISQDEATFDAIRAAIASDDGPARKAFRDLQTELIIRHECFGAPLHPYIYVVQDLFNALCKPCPPGEPNWALAIELSVENKSNLWLQPLDTFHLIDPRAAAMSAAAKALTSFGYAVRMGPIPSLAPDAEIAVQEEIESICKVLGGPNLLRNILNNLNAGYDESLGRYQMAAIPALPAQLMVPWGFLLHMAVKHFALNPPRIHDANKQWHRLVNLAAALLQLEDLRVFHLFSVLFQDAKSVIHFLRKQALFDSLYRIEQIRPQDGQVMWQQLIGNSKLLELNMKGVSVKAAVRVATAIQENSPPKQLSILDLKKVGKELGMGSRNLLTVVDDVFTAPAPGANQQLAFPLQGEQIDFYLYGLLPRETKEHWLVTPEIGSVGLFESVLKLARTAGKAQKRDIDQEVGKNYLEAFLIRQFSKRGIETKSGKYFVQLANQPKQHGECDIVIESDEAICFLEVKKKPLTRRAKLGGDSALLLDLAGAFVDAQTQCMQHEVLLKTHGRLELDRDGVKTLVEHRGRRVERIAVSMLDFGSLHHGLISRQFLRACLQLNFGSFDAKQASKFDEFGETLNEFRLLATELGENPFDQKSFKSAWFLSTPQILLMLDDVANSSDFADQFDLMRMFMTNSFDFYMDYGMCRAHKRMTK
jgi:hypothetical protein